MKLIIGLGNPEIKYQSTRHNLGQNVILRFLKTSGLSAQSFPKLQAQLAQTRIGESTAKIYLGYLSTNMNCSGPAVNAILHYFKIEPSDLFIIHDDLDLKVGEWRLQFDRSPAGHNGIKSIVESLGTQAFHRLRIGIDHPRHSSNPQIPVPDYVLLPFTSVEQEIINQTINSLLPNLLSLTDSK
jgi:PTH1 family peptidyl-tRNA hydrolase